MLYMSKLTLILFSGRDFVKTKRAYFDLFMDIYCKEKAKQSSIVQLGESIGFKLCFK